MIDVILAWFALFGVWPFADPGHSMHTVTSTVDVIIHIFSIVALNRRWKLVRR